MEIETVSLEEFNSRLEVVKQENSLVRRLIEDLGTWEKFPEHLIEKLFELTKCKPIINKY